jgi:hypothetical protein
MAFDGWTEQNSWRLHLKLIRIRQSALAIRFWLKLERGGACCLSGAARDKSDK